MAPAHHRLRHPAHRRGLSKKDIIRCLERYVARGIFILFPVVAVMIVMVVMVITAIAVRAKTP